MPEPKTLFQKVWERHIVTQEEGDPALLYIDLHLVHEVTSPQAFAGLHSQRLKVRRPERTKATMDHSTPTVLRPSWDADQQGQAQLKQLEDNCAEFGIDLYGMGSPGNGVVHVFAPEMGYVQPGMTIVCGDSHTSTHGAFGALAFGIGTSEVQHVLASQCLLQYQPKSCKVEFIGEPGPGVTAKDLILALIAKNRDRRCYRACAGIYRPCYPETLDGRAHDGLQYVD